MDSITTMALGVVLLMSFATPTSAQFDADFTATPTSGVNPLSVSFTDTTTGGTPTVWIWDFGDRSGSTEQHPTHTYSCPGSYTVSLRVLEVFPTTDEETKVDFISVGPAPLVVDFTASPIQGINPLPVAFTDTSTGGTVTAWSLNFGDGNSPTDANPTHTSTTPGNFTVSLSVGMGSCSQTLVRAGLITVDPAPLIAGFDASPTQGLDPLDVAFTDTSTGATVTSWHWDFGDSYTSSVEPILKEYEIDSGTTMF
jgi:PKD repeat protein